MSTELEVWQNAHHETVAKAVELLHRILEHKKKTAHQRWGRSCYAISNGSNVRHDAPDVRSPEVQLLLRSGLVQFISTCSNDDIDDDSLRLLSDNEQRAEDVITQYIQTVRVAR